DGADDAMVYRYFVAEVQRNVHVVFTMNPSTPDFAARTATSPALFNRCTVDWFGEWAVDALTQVAHAFTDAVDVALDASGPFGTDSIAARAAVVEALVRVH